MLAFIVFFFSFTLPNSRSRVSRGEVWEALPTLYLNLIAAPDDDAPARHDGDRTAKPRKSASGWKFFPQRFDVIAVAAFVLIGGWAVGRLLLRLLRVSAGLTHVERLVFSFGLGLAALSLVTLGCGLAGLLNRPLLGGILGVALLGEVACRWKGKTTGETADSTKTIAEPADSWGWSNRWTSSCLTIAVPFLLAIFLGAMLPSFDFDVKEYHLQGPKEFYQNGRITFLPHNVYTSFPLLTEMLSLLAMVLRDDWYRGALAGKAVLATFSPLTSLAVYAAGRRWFGPAAGWLGAIIHLTTPWVYRISIIAYAEGGLSFYLFVSLFAVMLALDAKTDRSADSKRNESRAGRMIFLGGLLAGSAMACKYPGVVQVVIPLGLAAMVGCRIPSNRTIDWRGVLTAGGVFAAGTVIAVGPWLLKNTVETGNPVYPLMWTVFGGTDWDAAMNAKWRSAHSPDTYSPLDLGVKFIDVIAKSDWQTPLLFAFAPLAFLGARNDRRRVGWLWGYVGFLFLAWWLLTHRIDRFWIPLIPVAALLAGRGMTWSRNIVWRVTAGGAVAAAVLYNLAFITTPLCGYNAYLIDYEAARRQAETTAVGMPFVNHKLPADAKVLCVGEAQVFDARRPVVYNTVFDRSLFQQWFGRPVNGAPVETWPLQSTEEIRRKLRDEGITHIYVNWQEVLRYRTTYGYTRFVMPLRFAELVRRGVLEEPVSESSPRSYVQWATLQAHERREVHSWGTPNLLRRTIGGVDYFIRFQIYPVRQGP